MAKTGRPTKLTPELQAQLCEILREGNFVETACRCVGIPVERFYQWLKKDPGFREAVEKAMGEAEKEAIEMVKKRVPNWQALAWFLERRYQDRWGNKARLDVEHKGKVVVKIVDAKKLKGAKKNGDSD